MLAPSFLINEEALSSEWFQSKAKKLGAQDLASIMQKIQFTLRRFLYEYDLDFST